MPRALTVDDIKTIRKKFPLPNETVNLLCDQCGEESLTNRVIESDTGYKVTYKMVCPACGKVNKGSTTVKERIVEKALSDSK